MNVWMVTGAGRGFGADICRQALERGDAVVATARDPQALTGRLGPVGGERLLTVALDVTDPGSVHRAVEQAVERFGRIDVLVNNAGHGMVGAVEEVSDAEARAVFEVNVFGVLTVTREVLPVMRAQRAGHVVMMSSMGGVTQPGSGWGIYGASKFALEGFSEAMRNELAPLGIAVTLVEPGGFRTDFLDGSSLAIAERVIDDYADTAGRTRDQAGPRNHQQLGDPVKAAAAVVALAGRANPPLRLPLGPDAVSAIEGKLASVAADVDSARDTALATSFSDSG